MLVTHRPGLSAIFSEGSIIKWHGKLWQNPKSLYLHNSVKISHWWHSTYIQVNISHFTHNSIKCNHQFSSLMLLSRLNWWCVCEYQVFCVSWLRWQRHRDRTSEMVSRITTAQKCWAYHIGLPYLWVNHNKLHRRSRGQSLLYHIYLIRYGIINFQTDLQVNNWFQIKAGPFDTDTVKTATGDRWNPLLQSFCNAESVSMSWQLHASGLKFSLSKC